MAYCRSLPKRVRLLLQLEYGLQRFLGEYASVVPDDYIAHTKAMTV